MKKTNQFVLGIFYFIALALPISSQSILKDGKIPKDLFIVLSLSSTIQFSSEYDYKITSDGKAFFEDRSHNLPANPNSGALLHSKNKVKNPKLRERLSQRQLSQLIRDFEKSGFFEMNEYYQGDPGFKEGVCINHAQRKGLSISANGKTKSVAFFLGCGYGEKSPLHSFLNLYNKIEKELQNVKKEKLEKPLNK
ncbi:MAG TPA: hypothetical protein VF644_16480 [Pyrinomonadaceae bacterium]|jgi:hypothetical protein